MKNDKFAQYIQNFNRRLRFTAGTTSSAKIDESSYRFTEFYRDSRDAFGTRFQVEKPSRDWIWTLASVVLLALAVVLMAGRL